VAALTSTRSDGPGARRASLICLTLLAACGEPARRPAHPPPDSAAAATLPDTTRSTLAAAMRRARFGDLDGMRARRAIRVLVPSSRTYFFYDGLRERGTAAEFFREFESWLNKRLRTERTPTAVVFLPVSRERLLTDLVAGRGDIAAGALAVTERRRQAVDFTRPVADSVAEIVVTGPGAPPLARLEDLAGREVYVRMSSGYAEALAALNRTLAAQGRPPIRIRAANEDLEDEDILELVNGGVVPITIVSDYVARFWGTILDSLTLRPDLAVTRDRSLAYAVRKSSPQLLAQLDAFVAGHRIGTSFGNTVARRYLRDNRWVRRTDATLERRRIASTIGYFRRSAGEYDLDVLLLMAQGYQESQLRQDLTSPAGAVGVMQLLPSTAEAPPISIRGVATNAEANIRAGAKYMRHLADTYFADTTLTRFNRQVFALAAYNAGPGRVASLRRMARAEGLDGDVWFQNVELVAGREIGTETTTYVRNILKYYVTYQLTVDTTAAR
jgi:membrane-bound lytic murein transglycosylase MltF